MALPKEVFEVMTAPELLAQAVRVYLMNQRKAGAKTKTRTDVNKTTAKMFKQKGTGNARHGSYAAPIFVGGGVAHGPDGQQNFRRSLSKPMTKKAILGALSLQAHEKHVVVLDDSASISKSKEAAAFIKGIQAKGSALIVATPEQKEISRAFRNLARVDVLQTNRLHVQAILGHSTIVLTKSSIDQIKKLYA